MAARPPRASRLVARQAGGLEDRRVGEPRVAGGAGDPAPVRVAAVDRGLDEAARDDRPGDGPRLGVVDRAGHLAGDERRRALAVRRLLAGEVAGDGLDRRPSVARLRVPASTARAARGPGREQEDRVVRARVAVDAQLVPRPRRRRPEERLAGAPGSTVASVRTTESIVAIRGMDHADALGDAGDA